MNHGMQTDIATDQPGYMTTESDSKYYQFEDINNAVVRLFRQAKQRDGKVGSVLDLGCGRARLGLDVERLGYTVTGIDNSPVACTTARGRISEVIELDFMNPDAVAAALSERQFDWIMAADVLEHSAEPGTALRFYRRFLKPDGKLIVSLPNVAVWDNRFRLLLGVSTTVTVASWIVRTCAFSPFAQRESLSSRQVLRRYRKPGSLE